MSIKSEFDGQKITTFEGLNDLSSKWSYRMLGKRCPNKGDFFLSGSIPQAYKAKQHLTTEYHIVEPVQEYKLRQIWLPKSNWSRSNAQ